MIPDESKISILIDSAEKEEGIPEFSDGPCPKCGKPTFVQYGLAGGGCGVYSFCEEHGIVTKTLDEEEKDHGRGSD